MFGNVAVDGGPNPTYIGPRQARQMLVGALMQREQEDPAGAKALTQCIRSPEANQLIRAVGAQINILMLRALDQCDSVHEVIEPLNALLAQKELVKLLDGWTQGHDGPVQEPKPEPEPGIHTFVEPTPEPQPTEEPELPA